MNSPLYCYVQDCMRTTHACIVENSPKCSQKSYIRITLINILVVENRKFNNDLETFSPALTISNILFKVIPSVYVNLTYTHAHINQTVSLTRYYDSYSSHIIEYLCTGELCASGAECCVWYCHACQSYFIVSETFIKCS